MCSVSGILAVERPRSQNVELREAVSRMNAALHHRGPDDRGLFEHRWKDQLGCEYRICLGNTRLAIIDISAAGHQPMTDDETGISISYNGEAYNFKELRSEIGNEFGPWLSTTDTEVVLRAYRKWGIDGLKRLRGMFALAIWDPVKRQLVVARDQFGIKPLYYLYGQKGPGALHQLVFSSEIRALIASGLVSPRLSRDGVASYLSYGSVQAPLTIIEGVKSLMPGECQIVHCESSSLDVESISIASLLTSAGSVSFRSRVEAAVSLREQLIESMRAHLIADVPLGVFLSGGLDSSALVALISSFSNKELKTFSVVFDYSKLSEVRYSRLVANTFGTAHQEITLGEGQLLNLFSDGLQRFDQPSMDGVNTHVISKALKEAGVTVALSGLGGDELFAGYPSFRRALKIHDASELRKGLMRAAGKLAGLGENGSVRRNKFCQLATSDGTPASVYRISRQLFDPKAVLQLGGTPFGNQTIDRFASSDPINEISLLELQGYMANTLLRDADNMSMAHSLEVRVPFVDVQVARLVLSMPGKLKLNGDSPNISKPLLAAAVADLLPDEVLRRTKMGFTLPLEMWMQWQLRQTISKVLLDQHLVTKVGLDAKAVGNVWDRFLAAPQSTGWSRPWSLYVLVKWCEINGVAQYQ